jgi:hypothetical protein
LEIPYAFPVDCNSVRQISIDHVGAVMTHLLLHACVAPQDNKTASLEPVPLPSVTAPAIVALTQTSTPDTQEQGTYLCGVFLDHLIGLP